MVGGERYKEGARARPALCNCGPFKEDADRREGPSARARARPAGGNGRGVQEERAPLSRDGCPFKRGRNARRGRQMKRLPRARHAPFAPPPPRQPHARGTDAAAETWRPRSPFSSPSDVRFALRPQLRRSLASPADWQRPPCVLFQHSPSPPRFKFKTSPLSPGRCAPVRLAREQAVEKGGGRPRLPVFPPRLTSGGVRFRNSKWIRSFISMTATGRTGRARVQALRLLCRANSQGSGGGGVAGRRRAGALGASFAATAVKLATGALGCREPKQIA